MLKRTQLFKQIFATVCCTKMYNDALNSENQRKIIMNDLIHCGLDDFKSQAYIFNTSFLVPSYCH